eukprot:2200247-Rhodomonas_salina.1
MADDPERCNGACCAAGAAFVTAFVGPAVISGTAVSLALPAWVLAVSWGASHQLVTFLLCYSTMKIGAKKRVDAGDVGLNGRTCLGSDNDSYLLAWVVSALCGGCVLGRNVKERLLEKRELVMLELMEDYIGTIPPL